MLLLGRKMFLSCLFISLLLAGVSNHLIAGGITSGAKPKWVKDIKPDPDAQTPLTEIENGYYYILYDLQIDAATNASHYHLTQKIVNQSGVESCSQLELSYNKAFENIVVDKVDIIRNGKVINKLDLSKLKTIQQEKAMEVLQYNERMTGLLILEDIKPGDILDVSYTIIRHNPLFENKFTETLSQQFGVPMHDLYYRILIPENRHLSINCMNRAQMPTEKQDGGITELTWHKTDIKSLKMDDLTPTGYDPYPYVQISEYKSWLEVKEWGRDIYTPVMISGSLVKQKAAEIAAVYNSDTDKIIATLRFVQDQIRYLGVETGLNTHKPHLPEQVLKQDYGDCKDKAVLFCCLLREMNIKAYPVLIETNPSDDMMSFLPSPVEFNHVCVAVDYGGSYHFFDTTINYQRGTFSSTYFPYYKFGLVLLDNTTTLLKLPFDQENTLTRIENTYTIHDTLSPAQLSLKTIFMGHDADEFRQQYSETSIDAIQKSYLNFYASIFSDTKVAEQMRVEKDDSATNTITLRESYIINNIWEYTESLKKWQVKLSVQNLSYHLSKPKNYNRTMPIKISYPLNYVEIYDISYPQNAGLANAHLEVENNVLAFSMLSSGDKATEITHLEYRLRSKAPVCPVEMTKTYHKDIENITGHLGYYISLNPNADTTEKSSQSGFMLFILLLTGGAMLYTCLWLYKNYDIVTPDIKYEPIAFGGWLLIPMLGTVLIPLVLIYSIVNGNFTGEIYNDVLFNKSSASYNPTLGATVIMELVTHVMQLGAFTLATVLLFKKRSSFPHIFIGGAVIGAIANFADFALINSLHLDSATTNKAEMTFVKSFIYCLIWIPYMLKSERVQQTFTNWHDSRPLPDVPEKELPVTNDEAVVENTMENSHLPDQTAPENINEV